MDYESQGQGAEQDHLGWPIEHGYDGRFVEQSAEQSTLADLRAAVLLWGEGKNRLWLEGKLPEHALKALRRALEWGET